MTGIEKTGGTRKAGTASMVRRKIIGGTNAAETLAPGSQIQAGSSTLDDITGQLTSVAEKLLGKSQIVDSLNR